jgi:hypothetical protein
VSINVTICNGELYQREHILSSKRQFALMVVGVSSGSQIETW